MIEVAAGQRIGLDGIDETVRPLIIRFALRRKLGDEVGWFRKVLLPLLIFDAVAPQIPFCHQVLHLMTSHRFLLILIGTILATCPQKGKENEGPPNPL